MLKAVRTRTSLQQDRAKYVVCKNAARAVDVTTALAKRIYILMIKVNEEFNSFSSQCFLKEIENMFFVFLSSYRNTRESLGELEKAVETLAYRLLFPKHFSFSQTSTRLSAPVPTAFLVLPNFHSCFYLTKRFHFAVRLFGYRSQMTSKCGKNKKVAHEPLGEWVTDVLTTF